MTFIAVRYDIETEQVWDFLGTYSILIAARHHCAVVEGQRLEWVLRWWGLWEAQGTHHWYRIRKRDSESTVSGEDLLKSEALGRRRIQE